ncbi:MAG: hypothetical protein VKK97_10165 [Synechococcaceae cyanobacterium]|nr:hypothetical protein [Synechococcaceae cyanobacterium]
MIPDNIRCVRDRAHLAGADWAIASKQGDNARAATARALYFRELEALEVLTGVRG